MKSTSFTLSNLMDLANCLAQIPSRVPSWQPSSVLVQVFSSSTAPQWLQAVATGFQAALPSANLVGATTIGEIFEGASVANTTVVSIIWFKSTQLASIALECEPGNVRECGRRLGSSLQNITLPVAGVLLLATPLTFDMCELLLGLGELGGDTPVFGGGAGVYSHGQDSAVFTAEKIISRGLVAVALCGKQLSIEPQTYLGWVPLSKTMTITETDGMVVKTIDGRPAYEVYNRYLDVPADEQFFYNVLEFPFLVQRADALVARIPVKVVDQGGLEFFADIRVGEMVRIGYGHLGQILDQAGHILNQMAEHKSDAIFLYSCCCRRLLMQEDANLETQPFETVASTHGFYTYGEFFGTTKKVELLNSTLVAVALREADPEVKASRLVRQPSTALTSLDPYAHKHARVISRLTHFIDAVTTELNQANADIHRMANTDDLTGLPNRRRMQELIEAEVDRALSCGSSFSVALIDVDHFKEVNDAYGHQVGDGVLQEIGQVLVRQLSTTDTVGRWGGEQFIIIFPDKDVTETAKIAEKCRLALEREDFSVVGKKSASFGVSGCTSGDTLASLLSRADQALYKAKNLGRNCVCVVRSAADLI